MYTFQAIQKLVLDGRIGEAISLTQQLYPGLLRDNVELLFRLKVSNSTYLPNQYLYHSYPIPKVLKLKLLTWENKILVRIGFTFQGCFINVLGCL